MRTLMAVTVLGCLFASSAEARPHHHHHYYRHHHYYHHHHAYGRHSHYAGRPGAWCGWYMRSQVGGDPGPSFNLARSSGSAPDQMPAAQPLVRSLSGVTTLARSSAIRMVNGSCRAAMTVMPFGRGLDHWPVPSLSGTRTARSKRSSQYHQRAGNRNSIRCFGGRRTQSFH